MVDTAFRKGRAATYVTAVLALFSVVLAGQFGLESMQTLRAGLACHQGQPLTQQPESGVFFKSDAARHSSGPHLRPKYVRRDTTADLPAPAVFFRASFGRVFHAEDRSVFIFSRHFEVQGPRPPPTIS